MKLPSCVPRDLVNKEGMFRVVTTEINKNKVNHYTKYGLSLLILRSQFIVGRAELGGALVFGEAGKW